ncbi:hypothetical protein BBK36DRAFT_1140900 [Trichoderma citrinoviride]|uniref:Uncharacterized protein n=1 Tax=Trichoderma citrinoviride TaxID=58853 RepID=A0A2T4BCU0_9HYPO|nr:hypothetical protein BBK36DRAFT_1140900 [Trichoderma citrinoviride]PTB67150.1 hypothetical protein BBK36DRAFT_1140900 [Trichoderma citrinoviride]
MSHEEQNPPDLSDPVRESEERRMGASTSTAAVDQDDGTPAITTAPALIPSSNALSQQALTTAASLTPNPPAQGTPFPGLQQTPPPPQDHQQRSRTPTAAFTNPTKARALASKLVLDSWKSLQLVRVTQGSQVHLAVESLSGGCVALTNSALTTPSVGGSRMEPAVAYSVRARACFLANGGEVFKAPPAGSTAAFDPEDRWKSLRAAVTPTVDANKHYVGAAYVGYNSLMHGPVFARLFKDAESPARPKPPAPKAPAPKAATPKVPAAAKGRGKRPYNQTEEDNEPRVKRKTASSEEHRTTFALKGLETYKYPLNQLCGQRVIPHYLLTSRCNLLFLKQVLCGRPLEDLLQPVPANWAVGIATHTAESIAKGAALTPMTKRPLGSWDGLDQHMVGQLEKPGELAGPDNLPVADLVSDATLLFRGGRAPSGFIYAAPLCLLMAYPPELLTLLQGFARSLKNDLLPIPHLYLAAHLWVDICQDITRQNEKYTMDSAVKEPKPKKASEEADSRAASGKAKGKNLKVAPEEPKVNKDDVPMVTLAEFLVYYNHWLRWAALWMGLAEFPHPFRFVREAVDQDKRILKMQDLPSLDQDRVRELIEKTRLRPELAGKVPGLSHHTRVNIFPENIPGVDRVRMHHLIGGEESTKTAIALTGLEDISLIGLESYEQPIPDNTMTLASGACQYRTAKWPSHRHHMLYSIPGKKVGEAETKFVQFAWRRNDPTRDPVIPRREELVVKEPSPKRHDDRLKPEGEWQPEKVRQYLEESREHYAQVIPKYLKPVWPYELILDEYHRLAPLGVDLPPPPELDGPLPLSWKATAPPTVRFAEEAKEEVTGPEGLQDEAAYNHLMTGWAGLPEDCHFVWIDGLEKLRGLEPQQRKTKTLLDLVRDCLLMEKADKGFVEDVVQRVEKGEKLEEEVLFSKLPSAFGRILGVGPMDGVPAQQNPWGNHYAMQTKPRQEDATFSVEFLLELIQKVQGVEGSRRPKWVAQIIESVKKTVGLIDELQLGNEAWLQDWKALVIPAEVSADVETTTVQEGEGPSV